MYIGAIFDHKSKQYKIKKINNDGVYASKMVDGKCQTGRPSRFTHQDVAKSLNVAVEKLLGAPPKPKPKPEMKAEEETPIRHIKLMDEEPAKPSPEDEEKRLRSIQRLLDLIEDEATVDDW